MKIVYGLLMILVVQWCVFAEDSPWEPGGTQVPLFGDKIARATSPDSLLSILDEAFRFYYLPPGDPVPDLYSKARSRIALAKTVLARKKNDPLAKELFSACSLASVGAIAQFRQAACDREIDSLVNKRIDALEEIKAIHEKINEVERSKATEMASKLKSDIKKMQDDADRKFKELQSSLIQVTNDARGTIISMSDILFETGKADLTNDLKTSLAKIAGILLVFKNSRVVVEGHTDNVGSEEYNQELSERRAENVMNFLNEQGVSADRLTAMGYGLSRPIADNETKEGKAKNRRVDLIVQEKKAE